MTAATPNVPNIHHPTGFHKLVPIAVTAVAALSQPKKVVAL